jgi:hypothetical protein
MLLGEDMAMRTYDLDALLHPAQAFAHPQDVIKDPDLTLNEKRAILASWASDACAVEAAPALRASASGPPVRFDDVMDALKTLDGIAGARDSSETRRKVRRRLLFGRGHERGGASGQGTPLY